MNSLPIRPLLAAAGLALTTTIALADERPCGNVPVEDWMNEAQLRERVAALGLRIEEIDVEKGCYEVEARDDDGREREILVHPQTGEQVRVPG